MIHSLVKLFALATLFGFLAINSNTAHAQTNSNVPPGYDTDCAHKLNEKCPGGFTDWFPTNDNYVREIIWPHGGCKITVFYQMRRCLSNYDNTEVRLNLCLFDGADPACFFIKDWSDSGSIYEEDPALSNGLMGWLSWSIFAELTKDIVEDNVNHWIEVGNEYPIPFCDKPDDGPNSPPTFMLASQGVCRGWCVVQNPNQSAILEKYNVNLSEFPTPEYSAAELASMNDFIQKEVNPKLESGNIKPFLPIENPGRARFVIKEYSCDLDHCCYSGIKYCVDNVKRIEPDGSYQLNATYYNWTEWYGPSCDAKNIEDYCDPNDGEMLGVFPCTAQCEYNDSMVIQDSTEFPTPLTGTGITRIGVAPHPVDDVTTLTLYANEDGNLNIVLLNLQGNKVSELLYNGPIKTGEFTKTFSMKDMSPGIYFLQITFNDIVKMHPIIKDF